MLLEMTVVLAVRKETDFIFYYERRLKYMSHMASSKRIMGFPGCFFFW